jgi:DNA-binding transcriptional MocR family regulator
MQATPNAIDALTPELYSGVSEALPVGGLAAARVVRRRHHPRRRAPGHAHPANRLRGYGHPLGFPTLRQHLAATLGDELFPVEADQILLTHGATHAFDLMLRTLTKPGDTVLVEDPGYSNLLSLIRHHGCIAVGIPRGEQGWTGSAGETGGADPAQADVRQHRAAESARHLAQRAQAHRLLGLAEQFDFWLVEDDIYRELAPRGEASLAAMDGCAA